MAELPASWGLKTKSRSDGKLDVVGKTDAGEDYKVRTCDSGAVTEADVQAIRECDREQYKSRDEGARSYVKSVLAPGKQHAMDKELEDTAEWFDAADRMTHKMGYGGRPMSLPRRIDIRPLSQRGLEKN